MLYEVITRHSTKTTYALERAFGSRNIYSEGLFMNQFYPGIAFTAVFLLFMGFLFLWIFRKKSKSEDSGKA